MEIARENVIFPLDGTNLADALGHVNKLNKYVGYFKVGLGLTTKIGVPQAVEIVHERGAKVFVDLKIHDIPNTDIDAVKALNSMGADILNVHASAGINAMLDVAENKGKALAYAVTVLTSLDDEEAHLVYNMPVKTKVLQFARDAKLAGMDGIICSAEELAMLAKHRELNSLRRIVPGIRPKWAQKNDQSRIMTPREAILAGGAGIKLVIGRPISKPPEGIDTPEEAVLLILEEIYEALEFLGAV